MQSFIKRQKIAHCYVQCKLIKGYHWILAKCKIMQTGVFLLNLAQPHPICSLRGKTTTPGPAVISADKVRNLGCKNLRSRLNSGLMFLPCTLNANLRNSQYKVIIFGAPWAWPGCCSVVRVLCGAGTALGAWEWAVPSTDEGLLSTLCMATGFYSAFYLPVSHAHLRMGCAVHSWISFFGSLSPEVSLPSTLPL